MSRRFPLFPAADSSELDDAISKLHRISKLPLNPNDIQYRKILKKQWPDISSFINDSLWSFIDNIIDSAKETHDAKEDFHDHEGFINYAVETFGILINKSNEPVDPPINCPPASPDSDVYPTSPSYCPTSPQYYCPPASPDCDIICPASPPPPSIEGSPESPILID